MPFQAIEADQKASEVGFSHAVEDVILHLWASSEFGSFAPCLAVKVRPGRMKEVFVEFMRENPAQETSSSALITLEKALYYGLCPGPERGLKPHMEVCISWERDGDKHGARNTCDETVVVEFVPKYRGNSDMQVERLVIPGKTFQADSKLSGMPPLFTVCPIDYISAVPLQAENSDAIRASRYSCVRR